MMRALMTKTLFVLSILLSAQALAFDAGGFRYTVIGATTNVIVEGCPAGPCSSSDIVIPDAVVDSGITYSVTYIQGSAFYQNDLTSVIIPDSVTFIGGYAFAENALTSVIIPDSVTTIAGFAFRDNALTSVIIPDSVTIIGDRAFADNNLTSVAFLGNFGTFNLNVFQVNVNLATITYVQGATGWNAPLRTFTGTGPTGSVTAEAAAPPVTPAAPTATAGDSQASVTWTKPADGGSTITGYTVTSAPGGRTCTTSDADTLTCDVTDLTNGTAYTFSLTATNGVGTSAASAASSSVTPLEPVPPEPTVATPVPTSPLWLLGIMAGLLSLLAIRKLRKA
jgi:hypothetical protein